MTNSKNDRKENIQNVQNDEKALRDETNCKQKATGKQQTKIKNDMQI